MLVLEPKGPFRLKHDTLKWIGCGVAAKGEAKEIVALSFFWVLVMLIEGFLPFSAHFNPVVALMALLCKTVPFGLMVFEVVVQLGAATLASYAIKLLLPDADISKAVTTLMPDIANQIVKGVFLEMLMTFVLMYTVLMTGVHKRGKERRAWVALAAASVVGMPPPKDQIRLNMNVLQHFIFSLYLIFRSVRGARRRPDRHVAESCSQLWASMGGIQVGSSVALLGGSLPRRYSGLAHVDLHPCKVEVTTKCTPVE